LLRPPKAAAPPLEGQNVVVVGAGVSGLSVAQKAAAAGANVAVLSERGSLDKLSPSQGAGGFWMPFHMSEEEEDEEGPKNEEKDTDADHVDMAELARETLVAFHEEKRAGGSRAALIEELPSLILKTAADIDEIPSWASVPELNFERLLAAQVPEKHPELLARVPEGVHGVWYFDTVVAHCEPYMEDLVRELKDAGVIFQHGPELRFTSLAAAVQKGEEVLGGPICAVFNCTGLGANVICSEDQGVVPGRGVLIQVKRPPTGVDAVILTEVEPYDEVSCCYAIPRGPELVAIGGSYEKGNYDQTISEDEVAELQRKAKYLFPGLEDAEIVERWAGLRPVREAGPCIKLERIRTTELSGEIPVVHNFGHGGGGWSVMYGSARWCVDRLLKEIH